MTSSPRSIPLRKGWLIAIPSYDRSVESNRDTLQVLRTYKIPEDRIYVFVNTDQQIEDYKRVLSPNIHLVATYQPKSIKNVRNFIVDYFARGQEYVSMDDDVKHIYEIKNDKFADVRSLSALLDRGFALCKKHNYTLWGLYPSANPLSMKIDGEYTTDLRFIVGGFMGIINQKRHCTLDWKEDYELSLMANEMDGGVIRFNKICVKHKIGTEKGGINSSKTDRIPNYTRAAKWLIKTYDPEKKLIRWNIRRPGEILFTTRKKKTPTP